MEHEILWPGRWLGEITLLPSPSWIMIEKVKSFWVIGVYGPSRTRVGNLFGKSWGISVVIVVRNGALLGTLTLFALTMKMCLVVEALDPRGCLIISLMIVVCLDPPLVGGKFIWAIYKVASRIDRFLIFEAWNDRFGSLMQVRGPRVTWPILLTLSSLEVASPFCFENMWLEHPSFNANLSFWWSTMVQGRWEGFRFRFMEKLRALKGNLKVWSREAFRNIRTKKKNIIARIDEIDTLELEGPLDSSLKG